MVFKKIYDILKFMKLLPITNQTMGKISHNSLYWHYHPDIYYILSIFMITYYVKREP